MKSISHDISSAHATPVSSELKALIERLNCEEAAQLEIATLESAFLAHPVSKADLLPYAKFSEEKYQKILLYGGEQFDLILFCWKSGQMNPIHDHSESNCFMQVIAGTITEITFARSGRDSLVPLHSERLSTGAFASCSGKDVHQMGNLEPEGSEVMSLHCYSPPLRTMQLFSLQDTVFGEYNSLISKITPQPLTPVLSIV